MEKLTAIAVNRRRSLLTHALLLVAVLSGPSNFARLISGISSTVTAPFTGHIQFAGNRYEISNAELVLIYIIAVIGLNLFFQCGMFSLSQNVFFMVGAYTIAALGTSHHISFWLVWPIATALSAAVGALLALPATKLGSFTFALISLGYAVVAADLVLDWQSITGGGVGINGISAPAPFDTMESFYWLIAAAVVVAYIGARNLIRSPFGRASAAVRDSAVAAESIGINPAAIKMRTFVISSAFAGAAGALFAPLQGFVTPDAYTVDMAILFLLMVFLGGAGTLAGPIVGAIILFRIPLAVQDITDRAGDVSLLTYGVLLILTVFVVPQGLMSGWWKIKQRFIRRQVIQPQSSSDFDLRPLLAERRGGTASLRAEGVAKKLGGVQALADAWFVVEPGTVHALIGPNGSGKTTFLNVVCGYIAADQGSVELLGRNVSEQPVFERARMGLARTFQTPLVFESMSCAENVLAALDARRRVRLVSYFLRFPSAVSEEKRHHASALAILEAVGLGARVNDRAGDLPPGQRRLLEIGRLIALEPSLVLMDEPAAGLNPEEMLNLERAIRQLREQGLSVLLIEHHTDLVMRVADVITVFDFGRTLTSGPPAEVRGDARVLEAYLGTSPANLSKSEYRPEDGPDSADHARTLGSS